MHISVVCVFVTVNFKSIPDDWYPHSGTTLLIMGFEYTNNGIRLLEVSEPLLCLCTSCSQSTRCSSPTDCGEAFSAHTTESDFETTTASDSVFPFKMHISLVPLGSVESDAADDTTTSAKVSNGITLYANIRRLVNPYCRFNTKSSSLGPARIDASAVAEVAVRLLTVDELCVPIVTELAESTCPDGSW